VISVFQKLKKLISSSPTAFDPVTPAREQFDGTGSMGNGGAMRVHPVALYAYAEGREAVVKHARDTATITHAHKDGINGAVMQVLLPLALRQSFLASFEFFISAQFLGIRSVPCPA
jgi:poly(ADP-ribose) glycohydrolase ARH3